MSIVTRFLKTGVTYVVDVLSASRAGPWVGWCCPTRFPVRSAPKISFRCNRCYLFFQSCTQPAKVCTFLLLKVGGAGRLMHKKEPK